MKKSQFLSIATICLTFAFGNTVHAQELTSNNDDQSWVIESKEKLNNITDELKQITSDESLSDAEKSNRLQEKNVELMTLINKLDNGETTKHSYTFDAKTPINCIPIEDIPISEKTSTMTPSKAEKNIALNRLDKAEESLESQKTSGKINDKEYSVKWNRIQKAKMQIASI